MDHDILFLCWQRQSPRKIQFLDLPQKAGKQKRMEDEKGQHSFPLNGKV